MAFDKERNFERKMHQGDWKCSECGAPITELPFEPAPDRPLYCRDCWKKKRDERFQH
jgi:CxxC-x17-CxxC domain-containing protein